MWYPVYADKEDLAEYSADCFKAKISLAKNWWESQQWEEEGDEDSSESSGDDEDEAGADEDEAGADEKDPQDAGAEANAENAGAEGDATNAKQAKKDKKAAAKAAIAEIAKNAGANQPEGTERFYNSAFQIKEGAVTGFLWTVDFATSGDAVGTAHFMGKKVGEGTIVDLDYENYIITHSCEQVEGKDNVKHEKWGLCVRDQNLSAEEIQKIWDKANEHLQKLNAANPEAESATEADQDADAADQDADAAAEANPDAAATPAADQAPISDR